MVLLVDRLDRLVEAVEIARRSRAIATQSMVVGMGLSFVAMGFATFGLLPPVFGALVQEGIDALAILNALRALQGGRVPKQSALSLEVAKSLREEHRVLAPKIDYLRELGDMLDEIPPAELGRHLAQAGAAVEELVTHEKTDEREVYRDIAQGMSGDDPLAAMSRTHQEIFHLARTYERLVAALPIDEPDPEDLVDLRRTLYALHAVVRLNVAQEEELYSSLDRESTATAV